MAFATAAQFVLRYDVRRIGQILSDSGTPVESGSISGNATITALLDDASAEILMACRAGKRYTQADLEALAVDADTLKANQIIGLTCALAWGKLVQRRGYPEEELNMLAAPYREAIQTLERLRRGELIFDIDGVDNAGVEVTGNLPLNNTLKDKLLSRQASRYFGCIPRLDD